eukprot:2173045-Rhodomonas_salina.2
MVLRIVRGSMGQHRYNPSAILSIAPVRWICLQKHLNRRYWLGLFVLIAVISVPVTSAVNHACNQLNEAHSTWRTACSLRRRLKQINNQRRNKQDDDQKQ